MVSLAETANNKTDSQQYVVFQIGSEEYGVDIERAKEIIKPNKITNVPNTDAHVLGVINLRGQIVPVVDLRKKFNIDSDKEFTEQRIITVEIKETLIGIVVDDVNEVVWLENEGIEPPPETAGGIKQEYLQGVGKLSDGERLLVLLDLEKLLFSDKTKTDEGGRG